MLNKIGVFLLIFLISIFIVQAPGIKIVGTSILESISGGAIVDTNATTACGTLEFLDGDGNCVSYIQLYNHTIEANKTVFDTYNDLWRDAQISNSSLDLRFLNLSGTNANQDVSIGNFTFAAARLNITNTSGTIAIFVTEDGFVGIGTTDTTHELDVHGHVEIEHTADETGDHAVEIDIDAQAFGDVKALFIDYITGTISGEIDEEVIFININQFLATGGDIAGLEIVTTEGGAKVTGLEVGVQINPIEQLSGIFSDMDSALSNGTNALAAFTSTTLNITIFPSNNDIVTIGNSLKFEEIEFILQVVASGAGIKPVFYHSTGVDTWDEFVPADGTNGMRDTGVVIWLDSDIPDWEVGTGSEFLIRINRTQPGLGTEPVELKVQIASAIEYFWDLNGNLFVNRVNATDWGNVTHPPDTNFSSGGVVHGPLNVTGNNFTIDQGYTICLNQACTRFITDNGSATIIKG